MEEQFNFSEALEKMREGIRMRRSVWPEETGINVYVQFPDENSKMTEPYIVMEKAGGKTFPLDLSCESIFAEDWVTIK